jgi:hypothetical protein
MPFCSKPLGAALSIAAIAAVTMVSPVHAQQAPGEAPPAMPQVGPPPAPQANPPAGAPTDGQAPAVAAPSEPAAGSPPPPPRRAARHGSPGSAMVATKVNLRSGPGTDSEIVATIPAGSRIQVGECNGEWCAVTWNGRSGYAIARNLNPGGSRQAGAYPPGQPGYPGDGYDYPPGASYGPGYAYGPPVVYGPAYYYGPGVYYGPGWGWRRHW